MSMAADEIVVRGEPASPGLAAGPLYVHRELRGTAAARSSAAAERQALDQAVAAARGQLEELAAASEAK